MIVCWGQFSPSKIIGGEGGVPHRLPYLILQKCVDIFSYYTYLQNKRMRRCGVAPPPIIFERLKLPQQIIYRRKENLSESPNHKKYWENILVSRFYEQFSRNRPNLRHLCTFQILRGWQGRRTSHGKIYNFCHPTLLKIRSKITVTPPLKKWAKLKLRCFNEL